MFDDTLKVIQIIFYIVTLFIAFYTFVYKRKEIFRNSLHNKQIDELCEIRRLLFDVSFDIEYVKIWADNLKASNRSLVQFDDNLINFYTLSKDYGFSVRCIKN